jgi:hypothetical protein
MGKYASEVKTKIARREFKVLSEISVSDEIEKTLIENANKNKKNRLNLKPHDKSAITDDEFIIDNKTKK